MALIKKYGVWLALTLTLAAAVWVSQQDESDETMTQTSRDVGTSQQKVRTAKPEIGMSKQNSQVMVKATEHLQRLADTNTPKDIFSPLVTAQNNPELNATSAQTSPANPFIYAGKIIEDGRLVVFLIDGEKSHAVRSGDVIEDTWKIKSIKPPVLTLRYLPLKVEMQMEIGVNS